MYQIEPLHNNIQNLTLIRLNSTNFLSKMFNLFWVFLLLPAPVLSQLDEFVYNGFKHSEDANNISLNGAAEITKRGILKLTNDTSRLIGRAFYPTPINFKNSTTGKALSFSTSFAFAIVPQYAKLGGHGFAFTISPTKELTGARPSQYLGLVSPTNNGKFTNHVFAVEFDTVQDFEFGDINDNHVGIDLNSLVSNESAVVGYFIEGNSTKQDLRLHSAKTIQAWIDYDSFQHQLNVTLSLSSTKPSQSILSMNVDLSTIIKDTMYVGFSASTGLLASSHYVFGWSFSMNGQAQSLDLSSLPSLPRPKKNHNDMIIGVTVSVMAVAVFASAMGFYIIKKIKNMEVVEDWELGVAPHRYSYKELKKATMGFKEKELLGVGGFGKVYKGTLPNTKTQVAVKRISHESKQGLQEFVSEISSIGRLRHRNLVQLLGWCRRREDLLLVYDFMTNGSLDKYIYDEPKIILSWEQRFKIIKGVASGLLYLHEEWEQAVIHRDIKAGNVLLDSELNGRLGDFGLAKLYEHGSDPGTTRVVGTLGYLAPELTRTGKPTMSSDVFAFGALLLEVVCGRRPIEPKALPEELILVDWVWQKWKEGEILEVVDPRLRGEYDKEEVLMVMKVGLMCSNNEPLSRPSMRQVVRYLEREALLPQVLDPLEGYDRKKDGVGFEDFVHSYPSSSVFEKVSAWSVGDGEGGVDIEAASASASASASSVSVSGRDDVR